MRRKEVEKSIKSLENFVNKKYYNGVTAEEMKTVLKYIFELEEELDSARRKNESFKNQLDECIHEDVIIDKIKEIEKNPNNPNQKVMASQIDASLISCLKELLEGE